MHSTENRIEGVFGLRGKLPKFSRVRKNVPVKMVGVVRGNNGNNGNNGNVAIKRGQRLLADYAEHEQRKDREAGLIMGIMGVIETT